MAQPNSLLTLIRRAIIKRIEPRPDPGEGWCMECDLTPDRRTVVIPADSINTHILLHGPNSHVKIAAAWPSRKANPELYEQYDDPEL